MALACDPRLLIADEPTTALDVTIQAQIMDLLMQLKEERRMATLLITHDLGVVAQSADRVAIMYNGLIMEQGPVATIFANPAHPYTQGLLGCIPRLGIKKERLAVIEGPPPGSLDAAAPRSFLDNCPELFAPQRGHLPRLREVEAGHWVRSWED